MSKRPKKSRHRVPILAMRSDPVTEEYQAEVDASMARLERRYRKAQQALERAEVKAQRAREQAERLAAKQAEAARIAENRAAEEQRLNEYIDRMKNAAKNARVAQARAELEARQREFIEKRNAATALRKAEAKERLERERMIAAARTKFTSLEVEVAERRRELHAIELLMMPGHYAGRAHRGRGSARHNAGSS